MKNSFLHVTTRTLNEFTTVSADWVQRVLGETGINVMSRVMGLILAALAVESILTGLRQTFAHT